MTWITQWCAQWRTCARGGYVSLCVLFTVDGLRPFLLASGVLGLWRCVGSHAARCLYWAGRVQWNLSTALLLLTLLGFVLLWLGVLAWLL